MFVAEAPGRLGAEVTGVPLFGDRTGDRFEELLKTMDWSRSQIFITNAILCNPRNSDGNNDVPSTVEVKNCSTLLERTISIVNPTLVIALGRVALNALRPIHPHFLELKQHAGKVSKWGERYLAVLYHPGPRTQVHRKWEQQLRDGRAVASFAAKKLKIKPLRTQESIFRENTELTLVGGD